MKQTSLHKLATDLADSALVASMFRLNNFDKPGEFIKRRSKEEREQIKKLKAEHFNDRIEVING